MYIYVDLSSYKPASDPLMVLINTLSGGLYVCSYTQRGDHMYVKCSWPTVAPGGKEDVSRPGERVHNQIGHLLGGSQGSRLAEEVRQADVTVENHAECN